MKHIMDKINFPLFYLFCRTKARLNSKFAAIMQHGISQNALCLWIANSLHLSTDSGDCVEHAELCSVC